MKQTLAVLLSVVMLFGCLPVTGFPVSAGSDSAFMRIVHLDCGRKYFSADEIKGVIDMAADNSYTHVELAVGNDGLRFLPDDMSVSVSGYAYESDAVADAVRQGNTNYYDDPNGNALTESEMDEILAFAAEKDVGIIPLLNTPGHMNALMDAGESLIGEKLSYSTSERTIDVTNETATAFTLAVLEKYIRYFAGKGCTHFNLGADEYANDISSSGFSAIQSAGLYDDYIEYVNSAAAIVKEAGMTPMAFNDGIYYNSQASYGTFDPDIEVCFWTSGWSGYSVAPASLLAGKGHKIINTNDAWYYVLGRSSGGYSLNSAQSGVRNTTCTAVPGNDSSDVAPVGCMLCVWCDDPSVSYTDAECSNIGGLLAGLAENNADYFTAPETDSEITLTDDMTGVSVIAANLQSLTVQPVAPPEMTGIRHSIAYDITLTDASGAYTGAAKVAILVPDAWNAAPQHLRAYVQESDGSYSRIPGAYADGIYTASVPHFSVVVLAEADPNAHVEETIALTVGESLTLTDSSGNYKGTYTGDGLDTGIADVTVEGQDAIEGTTIYSEANNVTCSELLNQNSSNWIETDYYYKVDNDYYPVYVKRYGVFWTTYTYTYAYFNSSDYETISTQSTNSPGNTNVDITLYNQTEHTDPQPAFTEITFTGKSIGETSVTVGNTRYTILVTAKKVTLEMYVGETASFADSSTAYEINGSGVSVRLDGGKIIFTASAAGTAAVATTSAVYSITVKEPGFTAPSEIIADHATTTVLHGTDPITSTQLENGAFVSTLARNDFTANNQTYIFWKARVIDRAQTGGGQMFDNYNGSSGTDAGSDNECMTYEGKAYDVDALKYENGHYYFRVADTGDWKLLRWTAYTGHGAYPTTGHQLIFYYMIQYVKDDKASINTSDWGDWGSDLYTIRFELYEVIGNDFSDAERLASNSHGFSNGIQVITSLHDPAYEVVRSEVDYNSSRYDDKVYNGQITDVPAVEAGRACTVRVYIRRKALFSVEYDWLNAPASATLPSGASDLAENTVYSVDSNYTNQTVVYEGAYTYTFSGWYLNEELTRPAGKTLTVTSDVILYGRWTRKLSNTITITAEDAEKVYDGSELTAPGFSVTYQGQVVPLIDGKYTIAGEELTITADIAGSQTNVGTAVNAVSNVQIRSDNTTEYKYTTRNGTLTVYPKITVEYYKDTLDADNKLESENYQTTLSPEHNGELLREGDSVTLSVEWLNMHHPDGYRAGVQQGTTPYTVTSANEQVIRVLYLPASTSLTIYKEGADTRDWNQTFLFRVTGEDGVDVTVTVHGNSAVTIDGLTIGKAYTVTELTEWSWRYGQQKFTAATGLSCTAPETGGITVTLTADENTNSVTCANTRTVPYWLDGDSFRINVFTKPQAQS